MAIHVPPAYRSTSAASTRRAARSSLRRGDQVEVQLLLPRASLLCPSGGRAYSSRTRLGPRPLAPRVPFPCTHGFYISRPSLVDPWTPFAFREWYTRGCTLGELIALRSVGFLSSAWYPLGSKSDLPYHVKKATGIPVELLRLERSLSGLPHRPAQD